MQKIQNKSKRKEIRATLTNKENPEQIETLSKLNLESKLEQQAYKKIKRQGSQALLVLQEVVMKFEKEITVLKNILNNELEEQVLLHPTVEKFLNGSTPKKVIIVTGKIINVVI